MTYRRMAVLCQARGRSRPRPSRSSRELVYVPPAVAATAASAAFAARAAHWDPLLTKQAIAVNSSHAPPGSYYVFFPSEGALYQLTKGGGNTVLKRAPASLDALSGAGVSTSGERLVLLQPRAAGF